jgi:hypothetical protein
MDKITSMYYFSFKKSGLTPLNQVSPLTEFVQDSANITGCPVSGIFIVEIKGQPGYGQHPDYR